MLLKASQDMFVCVLEVCCNTVFFKYCTPENAYGINTITDFNDKQCIHSTKENVECTTLSRSYPVRACKLWTIRLKQISFIYCTFPRIVISDIIYLDIKSIKLIY